MKAGTDSPGKASGASRRRYAAEFKRQLVRMSLVPGASAAKIALKHQLNANLLFKWRRQYLREIAGAAAESVKLLPVTIHECTDKLGPPPVETAKNARSSRRTRSGTIEIELPEARIVVKGGVEIELLRSVVQMVRGR
jgi:transposase